jgi:hypothetical protein
MQPDTAFQAYRAIYKIHVGGLERDILKDEVVYFDGTSMKTGIDKSVEAPTLIAAIRVGWLVPIDQQGGEYKPAPANVQLHKAAPTGPERPPISRAIVHDEERDLGHLSKIRGANAPDTHTAKNAGVTHKAAHAAESVGSVDEGVVVARFKTPAKSRAIEVGKDDQRVMRDLDPLTGRKLESLVVKTATGDVTEPRAGDTLSELLPDVASSSVPEPGTADPDTRARNYHDMNARAKTAAGSSSVGSAEEYGVVVGKVGVKAVATPKVPAAEPAVEKQEEVAAVDEVPPEAILQAKIETIQQFVPGFSWDMKENWMVRAKTALDKHKGNMPVLNAILSIETPPVRKRIMKALYGE